MLVDLPEENFCKTQTAVELIESRHGRFNDNFFMCKFDRAWVDLRRLFPISKDLATCGALFKFYADQKYTDYYSQDFAKSLTQGSLPEYQGVFVFGGSDLYWHFLVDHLSKIPLLTYFRGSDRPPILIEPSLSAEYRNFLHKACDFLNVGAVELIEGESNLVRIVNSFVPCVGDYAHGLSFLRELGASLQSRDPAAPERVFLRRGNVPRRKVINESELEERLTREFGFVAADPGKMSISDQINLVQNATIILGGHGGALSNTIFATKLRHLIELYVGYPQQFFQAVCVCFRISHHLYRGEVDRDSAESPLKRDDNRNYRINVDHVLWLVSSILQADSSKRARIL